MFFLRTIKLYWKESQQQTENKRKQIKTNNLLIKKV